MADLIVRAATQEDFRGIRSLIHLVQINPTGLDWKRFQVACSPQGSLLGCGQIKRHTDGSRELASIAVRPENRGRGIARAIILTLVNSETERPLFLMCRARLDSFYQKFGFLSISIKDMPPYFKRIARLERLFNISSRAEDRLLVMRLN